MSNLAVLVALLLACSFEALEAERRGAGLLRYPLPGISDENAHVAVLQGETAILKCRTTCNCRKKAIVKVSWLENGLRLTVNENTRIDEGGVLHIRNVTSKTVSKRVFQCVASVGNWSVVGVERRIHVIGPSANLVTLRQPAQSLPPGNTLVLKCLIHSVLDSSKSDVTWFKGAAQLFTNGSRRSILPGGLLVIRSVITSDAGSYRCKLYSKMLSRSLVSNKVSVVIGDKSQRSVFFSYAPSEIEVKEGLPVSIPCAATGDPPSVLTISHDTRPVSTIVASGISFANYTIGKATIRDAGLYVCYAKSGEIKNTQSIWLKVVSPPRFTSTPERRKLTPVGYSLSVTCPAVGNPKPRITWYKDGQRLLASVKFSFHVSGGMMIKSPQREDAGIYQCIAVNKVGSVTHSTFVFIEERLRPPINVKAVPLSASAINVTWQPNPINNRNAMLAHIVVYEYVTSASTRARKERVVDKEAAMNLKIDQLLGGTLYYLYLSTFGMNAKKSNNSKVVQVRTLESVPGISPQPINAVNLGNETMRVLWTTIPPQFANGHITKYKVEYGIAGFGRKAIYVPAGKTHIDITNLVLGELYTIEVSAGTSAGFGVSAKSTIKIGDPKIADQKGPAMELHSVNSSAVRIQWTPRKSNYITGFILECVPIITADYWHEVRIIKLKPDKRSYVLNGLNPEKAYRLELRIVSGPVISKSSVIIRTADKTAAVPGHLDLLKISNPRNLECAVKDNTSIYLSWDLPLYAEDVDHYTVNIELGGRHIEKYKTYHTKDSRYLLENLTRGKWYYIRVHAVPKRHRVNEVAKKIKWKFKLRSYQSRVVACKTSEAKPGPPQHVFCNVSRNAHHAKITWLPPEFPYGLITKYVIKYKHLTRKLDAKWIVGTVKMEPNTRGYPLQFALDADYYKRYRVEVSAVNSAGAGRPAVIESCALRRAKHVTTEVLNIDKSEKNGGIMSQDTKLGIIVGCSIASLFFLTFIVVFIWKNPFRVKSAQCPREDSSKTNRNGLYSDDFLYLQRLAEIEGNVSHKGTDCSSKCSVNSKNANGRGAGDNNVGGVLQPLMPKYQTAIELTSGSSGQPVCTCTCLLHGRLRGLPLSSREQREIASMSANTANTGGDCETNNRVSSQSSSSGTTDDVDSAESADSRTQILQKSQEAPPHTVIDSAIPNVRVLQQTKRETTFQV